MASNGCKVCCQCQMNFTESCIRYHCRSCGHILCGNCVQGYGSFAVVASAKWNSIEKFDFDIRSCKLCSKGDLSLERGKKYSDKIYPSESPRRSPEPPSPCFSGERFDGFGSSVTSFTSHPSPVYVGRFFSRVDEDGEDPPTNHFFSPSSCHDSSDIESSSASARNELYSFKSVGSSPLDSPARVHYPYSRVVNPLQLEREETPKYHNDGPFQQENEAVLERPDRRTEDPENPDDSTNDLSILHKQFDKLQRPLDFENNGLIWFPPLPDNENYESENNFFTYEDEDDEIGETDAFSSSLASCNMFSLKDKQNDVSNEPLRAVVHGHFRALVSQLLQGEGIQVGIENCSEDWIDIVTRIAWQAANYVKPDTSRGGSMDPVDYVKVKCIASGNPSQSAFIKGVVCTKNVKHKRMTSQYKNPRLLVLGGALEYQRIPNQLASFDKLLQQEMDHLKMIVSKIDVHRPNVLLVEKSVSSYAQEYLLAKEISLVLNVKGPLLERIARCTGALITPSIDNISNTRLGNCELFRIEKVSEEHEPTNQFNKKPLKTLMFFEGCPRRLGCTVLIKGSSRQELRKVKHVIQYAVFAAYHLSLETSFLADEGASLPKMTLKSSLALPERTINDNSISVITSSAIPTDNLEVTDVLDFSEGQAYPNLDLAAGDLVTEHHTLDHNFGTGNEDFDLCNTDLKRNVPLEDLIHVELPPGVRNSTQEELLEVGHGKRRQPDLSEQAKHEGKDDIETSSEYYPATEAYQSILVFFSSRCVLNGNVCERSRPLRIKFYGVFDKPLGSYLRDDVFDQTSCCRTCKEPNEAHVICYTHQQGNLTINVRQLASVKLPGERDGKIWMWHRCLKCAQIDGVPPATRRVVMSDAAWGLSFGKFLELSFSNHATANRVASCGHSLQRDCLRFYGFGSMVAFFRYSPIDILSVRLPPPALEFNGHSQQDWIKKEVSELQVKVESLYAEISSVLHSIEDKSTPFGGLSHKSELHCHILLLRDLLMKEKNDLVGLLQPPVEETSELRQLEINTLELNKLRHSLIITWCDWDRRLYSLDARFKMENLMSKVAHDVASNSEQKDCGGETFVKDANFLSDEKEPMFSKLQEFQSEVVQGGQETTVSPFEHGTFKDFLSNSVQQTNGEEINIDGEIAVNKAPLERAPSAASTFSDQIDSAWTGTEQPLMNTQVLHMLQSDGHDTTSFGCGNQIDNPALRRLMLPARFHSFDSALRTQERFKEVLSPSSLHLSTLRSFHASGEYINMIRDPLSSVRRTYSQMLPVEAQKLDSESPNFISLSSFLPEGGRLMQQNRQNNLVIVVYDDEPTSIISYALSSQQYDDWVDNKPNGSGGDGKCDNINRKQFASSSYSAWKSFGSIEIDYMHYGSYGSEDTSTTVTALFADQKVSPHLRISFEDDSLNDIGKVKFSVTCYFAKEFDALRKKCCPSEVNFLCSLSRCKRWSAQGGKSNVYFAKSLDERFIIKQVTKTELESFEEFAPNYFKYLLDSLSSGSHTCLAKILGMYQVTVKNLKGGKETKMDLMVMENLFFNKNISRIYDLKGSVRSRYNSDTTGLNKVLLDMNLLETLRTKPIFLGSKAKRILERAVWNDTSFLASVDVMDYSLLVGVDEVHKELVLGIIDFMRQYTWDKHLETWVKESGILGGPKNTSPTIVSPKQYKRRFRKAMTSYFLTVPDQWSS